MDKEKLSTLDEAMDWAGILNWLRETWVVDCGFLSCRRNELGNFDLRLSTGGWSENEEIIRDLERTLFWVFFWRESRRGGHYCFEVQIPAVGDESLVGAENYNGLSENE